MFPYNIRQYAIQSIMNETSTGQTHFPQRFTVLELHVYQKLNVFSQGHLSPLLIICRQLQDGVLQNRYVVSTRGLVMATFCNIKCKNKTTQD